MQLRPKHEWGRAMWAFIHTAAVIDSPDPHTVCRLSVACAESLRALADAIPCHACATAYRAALAVLPPPEDAMALFRWSWELHNAVNEKLGRPGMPYDEAVAAWTYATV
jgi:hypothetical protein